MDRSVFKSVHVVRFCLVVFMLLWVLCLLCVLVAFLFNTNCPENFYATGQHPNAMIINLPPPLVFLHIRPEFVQLANKKQCWEFPSVSADLLLEEFICFAN